jgi:hypothetical protein
MPKLVRRAEGSAVLRVAITLYPGRDDDLIAALEALPPGKTAGYIYQLMVGGARLAGADDAQAEVEQEEDLSGLGMEL